MSKKFIQIACISIWICLVGCFSLPSAKQSAAEKKTAQIEQSISKNEDFRLEAIKSYNYGVQYSLSLEPNPSKNVQVAQNLNDKSLVVSGPPSFKNAEDFKQIVNGLVSTNKAEVTKAENDLRLRDLQVVRLQAELGSLNSKLNKQEEANTTLARANAKLGDFLARIYHYIYWIAGIIVFLIIIHILSLILPPPYNSIFSLVSGIFGLFGKMLFAIAPKAKVFAGVVGADVGKTLDHVVASIQTVRETDPVTFAKIEPILKEKTDEVSKPIIQTIVNDIKNPVSQTADKL